MINIGLKVGDAFHDADEGIFVITAEAVGGVMADSEPGHIKDTFFEYEKDDLDAPCLRCSDCDADCNEVKDVEICHGHSSELGYCPYLTGERIQNPLS